MSKETTLTFIQSAVDIINQATGTQLHISKPNQQRPKDTEFLVIGTIGNVRGNVVLGMTENCAMKISSNVLGGIPIAQIDPQVKGAMILLGDKISMLCCQRFLDINALVTMTPPVYISGSEVEVTTGQPSNSLINLAGDNGINVNMYISTI